MEKRKKAEELKEAAKRRKAERKLDEAWEDGRTRGGTDSYHICGQMADSSKRRVQTKQETWQDRMRRILKRKEREDWRRRRRRTTTRQSGGELVRWRY